MVFDALLSESKADSVDICVHINNKIVQYKYKDSVCVCGCVTVYECRLRVCVAVYACEPVLGQDRALRGEAFPLPPRGRARCKTRVQAVCCGNAGQSQLFSASASREAGCTSHFPDASADTR